MLAKPASYNPEKAEELFIDKCTQCHKLSKVENYDFATSGDVEEIVERMIVDEELELEADEKATILYYMSKQYLTTTPTKNESAPVPPSQEKPAKTEQLVEKPAEKSERQDQANTSVVAVPKNYSKTIGKFLYENKCSECHKLDRVEKYEFKSYAGVVELVDRMVEEEGMEANDRESEFLKYFLHEKFVRE